MFLKTRDENTLFNLDHVIRIDRDGEEGAHTICTITLPSGEVGSQFILTSDLDDLTSKRNGR